MIHSDRNGEMMGNGFLKCCCAVVALAVVLAGVSAMAFEMDGQDSVAGRYFLASSFDGVDRGSRAAGERKDPGRNAPDRVVAKLRASLMRPHC